MNISTLQSVVAAFHNVGVSEFEKNSVNIFLVAANNVRKSGELSHDFEDARGLAELSVDGVNGGSLDDATITEPEHEGGSVKAITALTGLRNGGDFIPLDFTTPDVMIERDRSEFDQGTYSDFNPRYPSDAEFEARFGNSGIVQRGRRLYRFPRVLTTTDAALTVYMEVYRWLAEYTKAQLDKPDDAAQDFLLEHGFEWMKWACIIDLNYIFKTFVPRQEGNLSSPEKMRDEAWRKLVLWDSYKIPPNATTPR